MARTIAHISDLHFCRISKGAVDALEASLRDSRPDLLVVSGDFTQRARIVEFEAARSFLDRLGLPVLAVPGNHDLPSYDLVARFVDPYRRYRRYIAPELEPVWVDGEIGVVGVKSSRRLTGKPSWAYGGISRRRLDRALRRLDALPPGVARIVVVHHPLLLPERPAGRLPGNATTAGAARALAAFKAAGVQLVLSGHLHLSYTRRLEPLAEGESGPPVAVLPAGGATTPASATAAPPAAPGPGRHSPLIVQAASATSTRLRSEPNAYNWITIEKGEARVEVRAFDGTRLFAAIKSGPGATAASA